MLCDDLSLILRVVIPAGVYLVMLLNGAGMTAIIVVVWLLHNLLCDYLLYMYVYNRPDSVARYCAMPSVVGLIAVLPLVHPAGQTSPCFS